MYMYNILYINESCTHKLCTIFFVIVIGNSQNKEVQVSIATSLGSPLLNSASQQELKTSKESWATVSPITPHTAIVPTITPSTATVPTITTSTATVLPVTRHSPQSIGYLTTDTRTMNTDVKVPTSSQTCAVDCKVEERRAVGGVLGVPSPPKSSFLSPEVISDSSSISPEDKLSREPADEVVSSACTCIKCLDVCCIKTVLSHDTHMQAHVHLHNYVHVCMHTRYCSCHLTLLLSTAEYLGTKTAITKTLPRENPTTTD